MRKSHPLVIIGFFIAVVAGPSHLVIAAAAFKPECAARIRELVNRDWTSAQVGVCFAKLNGTMLCEYDSHKLMMPASNTKLFTSSLALHVLGPQFRFKTELRADGGVQANGTLQGNLYLVGGGDPSLMRKDLAGLVKAAQDAGLKRVAGALIADSSSIADGPYGMAWALGDLTYYYQPEVRSLSLDVNQVTIVVAPPLNENEPARIAVEPLTDFVRINNKVRVIKSGATSVDADASGIRFERIAHEHAFDVIGTLPLGAEPVRQRVSIPDPPLFAAHELRAQLAAAGITCERLATGLAAGTTRVVGIVESAPLSELTQHLNKVSDNLYAELFLRAVGLQAKGGATASNGLAALKEWMTAQKLRTDELRLVDGSGLSRFNLVSPRTTVRLLQFMGTSPHREVFMTSLPIMGEDGTLRTRMRETAAHKVVLAKTGTLGGVSTISGYVTVSGETYVFSIMINNNIGPSARALQLQSDVLLNLMEGVRRE